MSSVAAAKAAQASKGVIGVHKVSFPSYLRAQSQLSSPHPLHSHRRPQPSKYPFNLTAPQKYTVQSTGIWERLRRLLAVDPSRSNGVPLNAQFRNPPPGSNDPLGYTDPVTIPAADIAGNPYYGRDVRRSYPRLSVVSQADVVGLLTVGSKAAPKKELIGEAGAKILIAVGEQGERGLAAYFSESKDVKSVLEKDGLPPLPSGLAMKTGRDKYELTEENAYPEE
jgi:hypothetical protein